MILVAGIACLAGTWFGLSTVRMFSHSDSIVAYVIWFLILPMLVVGPLLEDSPFFWSAFVLAQIVYYLGMGCVVTWFLGSKIPEEDHH